MRQRLGRRGKSKAAAVRHGIARIRRQVQQDGLELRLIGEDRTKLRLQFDMKHNVGPQHVVEQLADPLQHCGGIHWLAGERVTPRERQQTAAYRAAPLDGSQYNARQPADLLGVRAVPFDQIRLAPDGLQDIIDIMGDAACELAESDHPIGMRRLRLHPVALGYFFLNLRFGQEMANEQEGIPVQVDDDDRRIDDHQCGQAGKDRRSLLQQSKESAGRDEQNV